MVSKPVDVLINVFGKPYQTALSLLSLLKHSGSHVRTIYFQEEPLTAEYERRSHRVLLEHLAGQVVHFRPRHWLGIDTTDEARLATDNGYRLSMRYQHGWEQSQNRFALTIHNDIEVFGDIIGELLQALDGATAIGQIGQCWWCPAHQEGLCSSERYTLFRPTYAQLLRLYNQDMDYARRRAYNLGLRKEFQDRAWPLPECRVNEWCALIDLDKARPDTQPFGPAAPLGVLYASGAHIGERRDRAVNLDTGVQWFRDMNHLGHSFRHFPIERLVRHPKTGTTDLDSPEQYFQAEMAALGRLRILFPDYARLCA